MVNNFDGIAKLKQFVNRFSLQILVLSFVVVSFFTFDSFGIGWDEPAQKDIGYKNYNYIFNNDTSFYSFETRDYGVLIELPLTIIEKVFDFKSTRTIYLMRHFVCHLFFLFCAVYLFKTVLLLYRNKFLASVAFLFLVLYPRFYEESFINSKDIPFLGMTFVVFYFLIKYQFQPSLKGILLLGAAIGMALALRLMALFFFGAAAYVLFSNLLIKKNYKEFIIHCIFILAISLITLIILWPNLWHQPYKSFFDAFARMSKFNWYGSVFLQGKLIMATNLPWYYIPLWIILTTPILYFIILLGGFLFGLYKLTKPSTKINFQSLNYIILLCLSICVPMAAVIYLHSILYDAWRHMYFVFAPLLLIVIHALFVLYTSRWKQVVKLFSGISVCYLLIVQVVFHPYQNVFFNELVSLKKNHIRSNYDMDYWGLSFRQSIEYILKNDNSPRINIEFNSLSAPNNFELFSESEKARLNLFADSTTANYYVTNYRWQPQFNAGKNKKLIKEFEVGNNVINSIYKVER